MAGPLRINVGRKTVRSSVPYGDMQKGLRDQFQASLQDLLSNFRQLFDGIAAVSPDILVNVLQPTFDKSQVLVPRKTGRLAESGYLEARQTSNGAEAEIGYGRGGDPDYAILVHEVPRYHHPPTQDKFLQQPVEEDMHLYPERIAAAIREVTGA